MNKLKLLFMDVDGTLTDGKLYLGLNGDEYKAFNVKDGLGIKKLQNSGVIPIIITGRNSEIVNHRAQELGIYDVFQGIKNKPLILKEIALKYNCLYSEIAYIGDDENDIESMKLCGIKGCPGDSVKAVKEVADYICEKSGGEGAVREFIEYLLKTMYPDLS